MNKNIVENSVSWVNMNSYIIESEDMESKL